MYVRSTGPKTEKMNLDDYPDDYPDGDKNCFDCKHFRMKLPVCRGRLCFVGGSAKCSKHYLLQDDRRREMNGRRGEIREHTINFFHKTWSKIRDGWRHPVWNFANVCEHFEDMRDEEEILIGKIIKAREILYAAPCLSTMAYIPETGEIVKIK